MLAMTRVINPRAPMPWLLIVLVLFTTAAAVAARSDDERLMVLAIAEAVIVAYFCVALLRSPKPSARKTPHLDVDGDQRPSAS